MLQGISNTIGSLPVASMACTATGLYIGRNWCAAAAYKVGSLGANLIASSKAEEWNQASAEYLKIAKNDGIRDLAAAAGLIAIGLASGSPQEKALPKKEEWKPTLNYVLPAVGVLTGFTVGGYKVAYQGLHSIDHGESATFRKIIPIIFARSLPELALATKL